MNIYTILGIALLLIGASGLLYYELYFPGTEYIEYNGVKISYEDLQKAREVNSDQVAFDVCNTKTGECVRFWNNEVLKELNNGR